MDIDGHGAIIMGGARPIGSAVASALADLGADVTILDADGRAGAELAARLGGYSQHCDLTDHYTVAACVTSAMSRYGQAARIIVNCDFEQISAPIINSAGKVFIPLFDHVVSKNIMGANSLLSYGAQAMMPLPVLPNGERGIFINLILRDRGGNAANHVSTAGIAELIAVASGQLSPFDIGVHAIECNTNENTDDIVGRVLGLIRNSYDHAKQGLGGNDA